MKRTFLAGAIALAALPAQAQFKPEASGDFAIVASQPAPWADARTGAESAESRGLQGKTISFRPKEIAGPKTFACKAPHYEIKAYDSDMLFQGGLTKPAKQAADLGFAAKKIPTLETGCEIDFHFLDADHALFALDNRIYRIERIAAKP